MRLIVSSFLNFSLALTVRDGPSSCKITPTSPLWPSATDWNALNQSVEGRLIAPLPPGAVCHPDKPVFNNESCALLATQWTNESFHVMQPASVDYNDDTCPPNASSSCSPDGYPAYVIAATNEKDIQAGVKFAHRTGVRLIVKGTGHDIPSRSSGRGSLSIWTHNIQGIEINLKPGGKTVGTANIKAGMRVADILRAAAEKNVTIVTGADPGVGVGGWTTGAGHGPLSSVYGLGADQVLSMDVVTADGQFLHIDENNHSDLFWAMRGGGGSTFAVIVSLEVRVYPNIPYTQYIVSYNTSSDSDTFWNLVTLFHTFLPNISEAGGMGYYYIRPDFDGEEDVKRRGQTIGIFLFPNKSPDEAGKPLKEFESAVNASKWSDQVIMGNLTSTYPSFSANWKDNPPEGVGFDNRLGSRLLDGKALTSNFSALHTALKTSTPKPWMMIGHLVAGPGPRDVLIPGGSNAVLPAWRKAYTHLVLSRSWTPGNETQYREVTDDLRDVRVAALKQLASDTGAYVNEADPSEVDWQKTYWGENYERLLKIKKEWDPEGVFWCRPCVGSELWTVEGGDAIGQHEGKICRR